MRRDFWETCEDRYQLRSTILTSQLPVCGGTNRLAIPLWLMAFSTGWSTTHIASADSKPHELGFHAAGIDWGYRPKRSSTRRVVA